ncbi:MAG TPA: HAMP domain-containing sensor histidine kinase [Solirubrobacteraceae bacterium]|jgi:two-component system OmpR family sensor kinase|nr:HAMP domain-containing sensor histidine kinase [Solirubrobacteraceae bacterium]
MSSLRARVLASVLALAAVGMIAVAAVTYAEQRSFLYSRADQQARSAVGALSRVLDDAGLRPPGSAPGGEEGGGGRPGPGGGPGDHGGPTLPPGTYGQRRTASGEVLGSRQISYASSESVPSPPRLPAQVPLGTVFEVPSVSSSGPHYRVYAQADPEDSGVTIAAVPLSDAEQTLGRLLLVEGLVIGGVLALLGVSAFFVVRLGLRPLSRIEVTAGEIAAGDLSRRVSPANTKTEVGRLGLALNAMLDRLEQAFAARTASEERLRRFLADASHELRTPLASIRGYAELFRIGAVRDPAGTENAMRRIEEESKRMGVLVEDLLALARLDEQPQRDLDAVDLSALARDAVQDARARAPEREFTLDANGAAVVSGDVLQLRQVFANLLGNAIVHTPGGTPVDVAVGGRDGVVTLTVADHGEGIPEPDREQLFERFWRREGGRERGRAGAGLGLAIVEGVVQAHHGSIEVRDADGGGAAFVVTFPAREPAPG